MLDDPQWREWQREHLEALRTLQEAQRFYHRARSGHAFATDGVAADDAARDALLVMDKARVRLDEVRARQPR